MNSLKVIAAIAVLLGMAYWFQAWQSSVAMVNRYEKAVAFRDSLLTNRRESIYVYCEQGTATVIPITPDMDQLVLNRKAAVQLRAMVDSTARADSIARKGIIVRTPVGIVLADVDGTLRIEWR